MEWVLIKTNKQADKVNVDVSKLESDHTKAYAHVVLCVGGLHSCQWGYLHTLRYLLA